MPKQADPQTFNEDLAYITAPDGSRFQVLAADGTVWDEDATRAAYDAYVNSKEA